MIKIVFKISIFTIILGLILLSLGDLFVKKNIYYHKKEQYKKDLKGKTDIAFFGSSHTLCTYDPRVFEVELGLRTFNFGTQAQRMVTTKPVMHKIVEENNLKLAVVDLFWNTTMQPPFDERISTNQLVTLDYLPLSLSKVKAHTEIFGLKNIDDVFPVIKHHSNWKDIRKDSIFKLANNLDYYKGYTTTFSFSKKIWSNDIKNKKVKKSHIVNNEIKMSEYQKELIDNTVSFFKSKNIPVIFVKAPTYKDYITNEQYSQQLLIKKYFSDNNIEYIDYNDYWDELGLDKYDFRDIGHLNNIGALKVSTHLSNYIKKTYDFGKTISDSDLNFNRYSLIENNFKNSEFNVDVSPIENERTGLNKIVMFKDFEGRYEILFLGEKDSIKDLKIRVVYTIDDEEIAYIPESLKKQIKHNKFSLVSILKKETNYKNQSFKVFKLSIPFKKVKDFKIINKTDNTNSIIIELKTLNFL